jgi:PadR family transcriptional regulator, regulatory protein PadR
MNESNSGNAQRNNLGRELARGSAELAVLAMLARGRCYGYELLRQVRERGGPVLEIPEGTLYPLLHRLEDAGLVASEWEAEGRARPRKYYAITANGQKHLALLAGEWRQLIEGIGHLLDYIEEDAS